MRNYEIAAAERVPVCQDSGVAVVMLEIGQDVHWVGGSLQEAIHAGIREGTQAGYLRWSVTGDPTRRLKMAGTRPVRGPALERRRFTSRSCRATASGSPSPRRVSAPRT